MQNAIIHWNIMKRTTVSFRACGTRFCEEFRRTEDYTFDEKASTDLLFVFENKIVIPFVFNSNETRWRDSFWN